MSTAIETDSYAVLVTLFSVILLIDVAVWATTRALMHRKVGNSTFIESLLQWLGSWYAMGTMAVFSVTWAYYDISSSRPDNTLDIVISIWTMLLDVLVIAGANYTRMKDRKTLTEITRALDRIERCTMPHSETDPLPRDGALPKQDSPDRPR